MRVIRNISPEELKSLSKKAKVVVLDKDEEVLDKNSIVKISSSLTTIHTSFNSILAFNKNLVKIEQAKADRTREQSREAALETRSTNNRNVPTAATREVKDIVKKVDAVTKSLNEAAKILKRLDFSSSNTGTDGDLFDDYGDVDERKKRRRRRGARRGAAEGAAEGAERTRARRTGAGAAEGMSEGAAEGAGRSVRRSALKALARGNVVMDALLVGVDYSDRKASGQTTTQAAVGAGAGLGGAIAGAELGATIGAFGGPFGVLVGGLIGGALGYMAASSAADAITGADDIQARRASGGRVQRGKAYIVGEKGPEIFIPGESGTITPHNITGVRAVRRMALQAEKAMKVNTQNNVMSRRAMESSDVNVSKTTQKTTNTFTDFLKSIFNNVKGFLGGIFGGNQSPGDQSNPGPGSNYGNTSTPLDVQEYLTDEKAQQAKATAEAFLGRPFKKTADYDEYYWLIKGISNESGGSDLEDAYIAAVILNRTGINYGKAGSDVISQLYAKAQFQPFTGPRGTSRLPGREPNKTQIARITRNLIANLSGASSSVIGFTATNPQAYIQSGAPWPNATYNLAMRDPGRVIVGGTVFFGQMSANEKKLREGQIKAFTPPPLATNPTATTLENAPNGTIWEITEANGAKAIITKYMKMVNGKLKAVFMYKLIGSTMAAYEISGNDLQNRLTNPAFKSRATNLPTGRTWKPGGTPSPAAAAPATSGDIIVVGDSIAVGIGQVSGKKTYAKSGMGPKYILDNFVKTLSNLNGATVIISTGMSNNVNGINDVGLQIDELKRKGAGRIVIVGVYGTYRKGRLTFANVNGLLQGVANQKSVSFIGPLENICPPDRSGFHPSNYKAVYNACINGAPVQRQAALIPDRARAAVAPGTQATAQPVSFETSASTNMLPQLATANEIDAQLQNSIPAVLIVPAGGSPTPMQIAGNIGGSAALPASITPTTTGRDLFYQISGYRTMV